MQCLLLDDVGPTWILSGRKLHELPREEERVYLYAEVESASVHD